MSTQNYEQLMNLYGNIKIVCIIGAVLFLIVAVTLFFVLKIPSVFGELTGRTAKKAIEEMTSDDHSGSLGASRKIGDDGLRRKSKITGILGTSKLRRKASGNTAGLTTDRLTSGMTPMTGSTASFAGSDAAAAQSYPADGTAKSLQDSYPAHSSVPSDDAGQRMPEQETTVLNQKAGCGGFILEKSIVIIHTNEVI